METKSSKLTAFFHYGVKMNVDTFYPRVNVKDIILGKDLRLIKTVATKIFMKNENALISIDTYPLLPNAKDAYPIQLSDGSKTYLVVF